MVAVQDYERSSLPERQKVALRLTDAILIGRGEVSPELREQVRRHLTPDEVVDLAVLVFRSSVNKIRVAMRTDAAEVRLRIID